MTRKKIIKPTEGGRNSWLGVLLLLVVLATNLTPSTAQCKLVNTAIKEGEEIKYDLFFHWGLVWKKAGDAIYTTKSINHNGKPAFKMELLASSNKSADVFFKMRDTLVSIIDYDMVPLYYKKAAEEGKRYTIDEATYSYADHKVKVDQKRTHKDGKITELSSAQDECVYDMISILAKARSLDFSKYKKGDRINFPMATGRRIDDISLEFRGTENIKTENRTTFRCNVFGLVTKTKKNKEKDLITFYITDDHNHLPVRIDFNLNFGSAQVILSELKGQRYPLESIVKK